MKNLHEIRFTSRIYICILVALLVRLLWIICIDVDPVSDSAMYRDFSMSIAKGMGYAYPDGKLTVYWAVGASAFYAVMSFLFGFSNAPIVIANLLIGLGVVALTYSLAIRYFNKETSIAAAWFVALWPVLIQFTTVYASELLFVFFLLASLNVWVKKEGNPIVRAVSFGVLLSIASYIRPTAVALFLILPLVSLLETRRWQATFVSFAIAVATAAVLFTPWMMRNQAAFGTPVLVSSNFGSNLWMGNNPQSDGAYMELPNIPITGEVERDQYFKKQAIEFIKANPVAYVKLAVKRLVVTYDRETIGVAWNEPALKRVAGERGLWVVKILSTVFWLLVAATALWGVVWALWRRQLGLFNPLLMVSGFFFIVPVLTVGQDRYHLPLNPFLAMFAAYALHSAWVLYKGNPK